MSICTTLHKKKTIHNLKEDIILKKSIKLVSLLMVALMIFSACGAAAPAASSAAPAASSEAAPASSAAPAASEAAPAATDVGAIEKDAKLVYWTMWNEAEPQGQVIAEAAEAFEDKTGVAVDINFNGRDIRKTLEPALAGGEVIDLFDEDIERVLNVWGNYLLPLDELANASYEDTNGQPYRSVVNATLINLAEQLGAAKGFADGGKIHNIPYQPSTFVVQYNKDLFAQAGITASPKTWEEFLAVCAKLKEKGITAITVDDAYMAALFGYTLDRIVGMEKCNEMVKNRDFSDPAVLKAAQLWETMIKEGYMSSKAATNVYPAGQVDEFAKNTVAMYLNGTWLPNEIKAQAPDLNWGQFAWPAIEATGDGTETNNYGCQTFGINKSTKYPNAAFAFVRFMTVGEWDQKLADTSMGVPVANDATWPKQIAEAKSIIDSTTKRLNWAAGMEDDPEINTAIKEAFAKMVSGTGTAQQFADAMKALKK